jgi:isoquinoline 1-oxidoreductase beta subunit
VNTPASSLSRREFIRVTTLTGGGFMLSLALPGEAWAQTSQALDDTTKAFTPGPFIKITPENIITILAKSPETGQGVRTSLPMIVAEELDVDFSQVVVEQAALRTDVGGQSAGGSRSTPNNYMPLRRAGATARAMLVEAAAQTWGVRAEELTTDKGKVIHAATGRSLTYGQLATKAATLPIPDEKDVKLKSEDQFKILGARVGGVDNPAIVTGKSLFGIDLKLPGMVYAAYEKCPVFGGKVISANLDRIKALPGVRDAFILEGTDNPSGLLPGIAIIADSTWAAFAAKRQLQVVWDESAGPGHSNADYVTQAAAAVKTGGKRVRNDGDVEAAFAAGKVIEANYSYPFLNHATLEPQGCVAWAKDDGIELWSTSQTPGPGQQLVADTLKIPKEKLKVNLVRAGGGFGRRLANDYMVEAAAIAQRTNGAPVKLTWTREDDMRHDCYHRPAGFHHFKGAVDAAGKLSAWQNHFVTFGYKNSERPVSGGGFSPDEMPARFLSNYRFDWTILPTIVPCGPLRAPGSNGISFAVQGFIDELAHAAGRDQVEFRLELLGDDRVVPASQPNGVPYDAGRMKGVVKLAAEKAGWGKKLPKGEGLGIAYHFSHSGYVAMAAEVAVAKDGTVKVRHVSAAIDVGPIINMSGAENQIQGSIIDGLGMAWLQEITIDRGRVVQSNFHDFPLLRSTETPAMTVSFIQSKNPPTGLGEPAYPVVPPAICNAIFAATGKRIRQLPFNKTDLSWS